MVVQTNVIKIMINAVDQNSYRELEMPDRYNEPSYQKLLEIVRNYSPETVVLPESRLYHDLGINGDDAESLILEIQEHFGIELEHFDIELYFEAESPFVLLRIVLSLIQFEKPERPRKIALTVDDLFLAIESGSLRNHEDRYPE